MLRTTTLSAAALLGLTLLAPPGAQAAGETCQGRPATIIGTDRATPVVGTDGPDVIVVTGNARVVDARGGDDLICVVDSSVRDLDAGPGDDVVDVSAGYGSRTVLGPGADTYVGGPGRDEVWAGTRERRGSPAQDTETDVIDTGAGQESDAVHSGERGVPNGDQVRVGVMAEVSWAGTPTTSSVLSSVRYGSLTLDLAARDRVRVDNAAEVVTWDGAPLALPGFTSFTVTSPSSPRALSFRGNDHGYEYLTLDLPRPRKHRVDMGDGTNELDVSVGRPLARGTTYRAGSGRDRIGVELPRGDVTMDLAAGTLRTRLGRSATSAHVDGFAVAAATAQRATLRGTRLKDTLYVAACHGRVEGRRGADSLGALQRDPRLRCTDRSFTALGGPGDDDLWGSVGADLLLGGPGRDEAAGRGGRDVCSAEVVSSCEVRR